MFFSKIKTKFSFNNIVFGFGLIIFLMLTQTTLALWRFQKVKMEFEKVVDVYNVRMQLVQKMRVIARERTPMLFAIVNTDDAFEIDEFKIQFQLLGNQFIEERNKLIGTNLSKKELKLLDIHRKFAQSIGPAQRKVIDLVDQEKFAAAIKLLVEEVSPNQLDSLDKLDNLVNYERSSARLAKNKAKAVFERTQRDLIITTTLGTLISLFIAIVVSFNLIKTTKKLKYVANYDALTGLPNRSLFLEHLTQSMKLADRRKKSLGLLFVDLDGFKIINDKYGHNCGDELLRQVAARMRKALRAEDVVSRLGGDEFTVITHNLSEHNTVSAVAEKIIATLSQPFQIMGKECCIGSSIGIASYPNQSTDLDELISFADSAMYVVKRSGKNNFKRYDGAIQTLDACCSEV